MNSISPPEIEYIDSIRPRGWDFDLWREAYWVASTLTRDELFTFMSTYIRGLEAFSKTEMLDILPEIGMWAGRRLAEKSSNDVSRTSVLHSKSKGVSVDALEKRKATRQ